MTQQARISRRVPRLSVLFAAISLIALGVPASADPVSCEHFPASAGPDGVWDTADDVLSRTYCGASFSPAPGSTNLGNVLAARGGTAIGQGVVVEATSTNSDSTLTRIGSAPDASVGIGFATRVDGNRNVAVGGNARIGGLFGEYLSVEDSVAVGSQSLVTGNDSTAIGSGARSLADEAIAIGSQALANARGATVVGAYAGSRIEGGVAIGRSTFVNGAASVGVTINTVAVPATIAGTAIGDRSRVGDNSVALGGFAVVGLRNSFALIHNGTALGAGTLVSADGGVAVGALATVSAASSVSVGTNASATAANSVALGADTVADEADTVAVGDRRIVGLADAINDTDAVNLSQLYPLATALGGGASYAGGIFTAPTYIIQASNYTDIGSAFSAVDSALTDINQRIVDAGGIQGERGLSAYEVAVSNGFAGTEGDWLQSLNGPQGPSGPTGPEGPAGGGPRSVTYDSDTRDVLTMAGADGTRIANVADGVEATDAVNLGQMEAGDAGTLAAANEYTDNTATETLSSANAYTDQRFAEITGLSDSFESFRNETDRRFQQQDRRIDKLSAMSGAYAGMAMNTSGLAGRNRIGVGVGAQGGEQALAVGYQRAIGNHASVSIAGAFSGDEKSVSAGAGFSW